MRKKIKIVRNLLGEQIVSPESLAELGQPMEQGELFDNSVSPELKRERKLARQHREEGGQELFPDNSK